MRATAGYLLALADPMHPLHETMVELDDPEFDPHKVDVAALANNLANLARYIGKRKSPGARQDDQGMTGGSGR